MEELLPRDFLYNWRKKSWDRFQKIGSKKQHLFPHPTPQPAPFLPKNSSHILFVDGFFIEERSHVPEPMICLSLDVAMRSYGVFLQNRIARTLSDEMEPFAALNGAFQGRGILLYVPPEYEGAEFLEIHHHYTTESMATPRIHLYVGQGSHLKIIETMSYEKEDFFANSLFDATLDEKSTLDLYQSQTLSPKSTYFQAIRATLKKESRCLLFTLMKGAQRARTSFKAELLGENSEALLNGLVQLKGERENQIHATLEHVAPHTRSRQNFKTVLYDRSRSSFEGKIIVRPLAQKTEAYQLNANLPLGDEVQVQSKPNLEIFADDVKASHGATVAQIQEEDLFYLRSRGLSLEEARRWLIRGFYQDLLDAIPIASLKKEFEDDGA